MSATPLYPFWYWNIGDPASGYTAIHRHALERLEPWRLDDGYFFETDILFQLNLIDAVVEDVPLPARYSGEVSTLRINRVLREFPALLVHRMSRRIGRKYLRGVSRGDGLRIAAVPLLMILAAVLGWLGTAGDGITSSMLLVGAITAGLHLLLSAIRHDMERVPRQPISWRDETRR